MKFLDELRGLDRNNIGSWPQSVKIFFTGLLFLLVILVGWYFYISSQQDELTSLVAKEGQLKQDFTTKQAKAVNLDALQQQLDEMKDMLRQLLRQLPSKTEMPELLIDVSQTALSAGLQVGFLHATTGSAKGLLRRKADPVAHGGQLSPIWNFHQWCGLAAEGGNPDHA